jgi:hypothetical protein
MTRRDVLGFGGRPASVTVAVAASKSKAAAVMTRVFFIKDMIADVEIGVLGQANA